METITKTLTLPLEKAHIKTAEDGRGTFEGYASVFGNRDAHGDVIKTGAFDGSFASVSGVKMFFNHDTYELPVGKWLDITEDDHGLYVKGELTPNMSRSDDIYAAMKHGTVSGMSVGFGAKMSDVEKTDTGYVFNKISTLNEISLCTNPANDLAGVSVFKSMNEMASEADIEKVLRLKGGFSRAEVRALMHNVKRVLGRCDAGEGSDGRCDADNHDLRCDAEGNEDENRQKMLELINNTLSKGI